jgi:hypothetical protein
MRPFRIFVLLLLLPAAASSQPAPAPAPEITFQAGAVAVTGVSPRGKAVLFGEAREIAEDDVATLVRRSQVLTDDDGDGAVTLDVVMRYTAASGNVVTEESFGGDGAGLNTTASLASFDLNA